MVQIARKRLLGTKAYFLCFPASSVMRILTELSSSGEVGYKSQCPIFVVAL